MKKRQHSATASRGAYHEQPHARKADGPKSSWRSWREQVILQRSGTEPPSFQQPLKARWASLGKGPCI